MVFGCTEWKTSFDRCFATLVIEKFELRAGCTQGLFKASQMAKSDLLQSKASLLKSEYKSAIKIKKYLLAVAWESADFQSFLTCMG